MNEVKPRSRKFFGILFTILFVLDQQLEMSLLHDQVFPFLLKPQAFLQLLQKRRFRSTLKILLSSLVTKMPRRRRSTRIKEVATSSFFDSKKESRGKETNSDDDAEYVTPPTSPVSSPVEKETPRTRYGIKECKIVIHELQLHPVVDFRDSIISQENLTSSSSFKVLPSKNTNRNGRQRPASPSVDSNDEWSVESEKSSEDSEEDFGTKSRGRPSKFTKTSRKTEKKEPEHRPRKSRAPAVDSEEEVVKKTRGRRKLSKKLMKGKSSTKKKQEYDEEVQEEDRDYEAQVSEEQSERRTSRRFRPNVSYKEHDESQSFPKLEKISSKQAKKKGKTSLNKKWANLPDGSENDEKPLPDKNEEPQTKKRSRPSKRSKKDSASEKDTRRESESSKSDSLVETIIELRRERRSKAFEVTLEEQSVAEEAISKKRRRKLEQVSGCLSSAESPGNLRQTPSYRKKLFQSEDNDDSDDFLVTTRNSLRQSSRRRSNIVQKKSSKKYPSCLEDLVDFPLAKRSCKLDLLELKTDFVDRAVKGEVDWNLYNRDPDMEEQRYQDRIEAQKEERSQSDHSSEEYTPTNRRQRQSLQRQSPSKRDKIKYSEERVKEVNGFKENENGHINSLESAGHDRVMTRSARRKRHLKISYLENSFSKTEQNILQTPLKKGEEEPLLVERLRDPFSDVRAIRYDDGEEVLVTPEKRVLALCNPPKVESFGNIPAGVLKDIVKIGEGDEGEVYLSRNPEGKELVFKIIPLDYGTEGDDEDEVDPEEVLQTSFAKVLPELMVCTAFQTLRTNDDNRTINFIHMKRAYCVQGAWPQRLVEEWDKYRQEMWKKTENDWHPDSYDADQYYVIMTLNNGGQDLESFEFVNCKQAVSIVLQVAFSLAAAEASLQFEHRDLHWGNVLIKETEEQDLEYIVDRHRFSIPSAGIFVSIIDFSLSRVYKKGTLLHRDLEDEEGLFDGKGDPQYEVYRKMRSHTQGDWAKFSPKTNIYWVEYLVEKILNFKHLKSESESDIKAVQILNDLHGFIEGYDSCQHLIESQEFQEIVKVDWSSFEQ